MRNKILLASCLCLIPGCYKKDLDTLESDDFYKKQIARAFADVPIPPAATCLEATLIDRSTETFRATYRIAKAISYAQFYEQAADIYGWSCAWSSGITYPWARIFHKPGKILLIEQQNGLLTIYRGIRTANLNN